MQALPAVAVGSLGEGQDVPPTDWDCKSQPRGRGGVENAFSLGFLHHHGLGREQQDDLFLDFLDLVEGDVGVLDDEDLTGFAVLVDAEGAAGGGLGVGLAEEFLALEHEGEDVAGVFRMFLILLAERAQEFLRALFGDSMRILGGEDGTVGGAPRGKGCFILRAALFPCFLQEILAEVAGGFGIGEDRGDDGLPLDERGAGCGALAGAGAQVPGFVECHGSGIEGEKAFEGLVDGASGQAAVVEPEAEEAEA